MFNIEICCEKYATLSKTLLCEKPGHLSVTCSLVCDVTHATDTKIANKLISTVYLIIKINLKLLLVLTDFPFGILRQQIQCFSEYEVGRYKQISLYCFSFSLPSAGYRCKNLEVIVGDSLRYSVSIFSNKKIKLIGPVKNIVSR